MADTTDDTRTDEAPLEDAAPAPEPPDLMRRLEALFMVADTPQPVVQLASSLGVPIPAVQVAIEELVADFDGELDGPRRGFELREIAGGWRLYVRPEFDQDVTSFVHAESPTRLTQAALETLAVIAYRQPISRGAVSAVRAVNVDSVVRTLLGRGLVVEVGQDPDTGAILYGTTDLLLEHLGIASIEELPLISPMLPGDADGDA